MFIYLFYIGSSIFLGVQQSQNDTIDYQGVF